MAVYEWSANSGVEAQSGLQGTAEVRKHLSSSLLSPLFNNIRYWTDRTVVRGSANVAASDPATWPLLIMFVLSSICFLSVYVIHAYTRSYMCNIDTQVLVSNHWNRTFRRKQPILSIFIPFSQHLPQNNNIFI